VSLPTTFDPIGIFAVLHAQEVRFVAIGGWAAGVQGAVWPTFDVDVVIEDDESNLEQLAVALEQELAAPARTSPRRTPGPAPLRHLPPGPGLPSRPPGPRRATASLRSAELPRTESPPSST
jgi:hypothetical protein